MQEACRSGGRSSRDSIRQRQVEVEKVAAVARSVG